MPSRNESTNNLIETHVTKLEETFITNFEQYCENFDQLIEDIEAADLSEKYDQRMHRILDRMDLYIQWLKLESQLSRLICGKR